MWREVIGLTGVLLVCGGLVAPTVVARHGALLSVPHCSHAKVVLFSFPCANNRDACADPNRAIIVQIVGECSALPVEFPSGGCVCACC